MPLLMPILILALAALLAWHFPERMTPDTGMRMLYLLMLLAVVGGFSAGRFMRPGAWRHAGIWMAIILGLAAFYQLLA